MTKIRTWSSRRTHDRYIQRQFSCDILDCGKSLTMEVIVVIKSILNLLIGELKTFPDDITIITNYYCLLLWYWILYMYIVRFIWVNSMSVRDLISFLSFIFLTRSNLVHPL